MSLEVQFAKPPENPELHRTVELTVNMTAPTKLELFTWVAGQDRPHEREVFQKTVYRIVVTPVRSSLYPVPPPPETGRQKLFLGSVIFDNYRQWKKEMGLED